MGEPAPLTDKEHLLLRRFAKSVVDAVRNDEEQPSPTWPDGDAMDEGTMIFKLSQMILEEGSRSFGPDRVRIDRGEFVRAGGDAVCDVCELEYWRHPTVSGFAWLHRACDGRLLKL